MKITKEMKDLIRRALKLAHCDGKEGFEFNEEDYFIIFEQKQK